MINSVIRPVNRPFNITDHRVDPSKGFQRNTFRATTGDNADVLASCIGNRGKTGQSIRDHEAIGAKMALGLLRDFFGAKTVDYIHIHRNRMSLFID